MSKVPDVVARYFEAANGFRADEMVECFSPNALVQDEAADYVGHEAIHGWIAETTKKYQPRYELVGSTASPDPEGHPDGRVISVMASVSGTFSGSPLVLDFEFTVRGGKIEQLAIG